MFSSPQRYGNRLAFPPQPAGSYVTKALPYLRRGILFYWYTGERRIAITSVLVTSIVYLIALSLFGATNLFVLVLLLLMDHLVIVFIAVYVIAIRTVLPDMLIEELDAFIMSYSIYIIAGWIGNRIITNLIASKLFGYRIS